MTNAPTLKPIIRLLCLALVGSTMLLLGGCADGPGNGTTVGGTTSGTSGGTTSGTTSGSTGGTTGGTTGTIGCTTDCAPLPVQCPDPTQTFTAFKIADANVTVVNGTGICLGCLVENAIDVIDDVTTNFATMSIAVGALAAGNSLTVTDTETTFPAGAVAGFVVAVPADVPVPRVTADVLQSVTVSTFNNGVATGNSATGSSLLVLDLVGLLKLNNEALHFVSAGPTTQPFDAARINLGGLVSALTTLHVYGAGICQ